MRKLLMAVVVGLVLNKPVIALDIISPNPNLQPKNVVEIQLQSLQRNDEPIPDAGIFQTWAFAHPNNRFMTGPIERFLLMMKSQNYKDMLNHLNYLMKLSLFYFVNRIFLFSHLELSLHILD